MNSSAHLLVLMSIILGLGIRDLLVGGRAAAIDRPREDLALLPFLAGLLVLLATVQFWWYLFIVANRDVWGTNFFLFATVLLRPALLFLSAASVFPPAGQPGNLADHYFRNRGFIYLPLAAFELHNLVESATNLGTLRHAAHIFHVLFTIACVVLAFSSSRKLHRILLSLLLVSALVFIGAFSLRLT
jgi:hypothetical protein